MDSLDQDEEIFKHKEKLKLTSLILGIITLIFLTIKTVYLYPQKSYSPLIPSYIIDLEQNDFKLFFIPCLILFVTYSYLHLRKNYNWALALAILTLIVSYFNPFLYLVI